MLSMMHIYGGAAGGGGGGDDEAFGVGTGCFATIFMY